MKKIILLIAIFASQQFLQAQTNTFPLTGSVGIGTLAPHASSVLEMQSTSQGMLAPRMTKAQRNAIVAPATGLLIYQTNSSPGFYYYTGSMWSSIAAGLNLPYSISIASDVTSPFQITNTGIAATVSGINNGAGGIGIYGRANGTGFTSGVYGSSESGYGVQGHGGAGGGLGGYFSADLGYALVTGNGAVGFGETNPTAKVHIDGASYTRALQVEAAGITKFSVNSDGSTSIGADVSDGPDNGLYVSGSTGIGTSTPNSKLQINSVAGENPFRVQVDGSTKLFTSSNGGTTIGSLSLPPANGLYVAGNLGVGISTPAVKLHINGTNEVMRITGTNPYVQFYSGSSTEIGYARANGNDFKLSTNSGNTLGRLVLGADGLERIFIHETGEVTINTGTAYPNFELGVNGDLYVSSQIGIGTTAVDATAEVTISGIDDVLVLDGTEPYITLRDDAEDVGYLRAQGEDLRLGIFGANSDGRVIIASNSTTRMYIDHSGNIVMGDYSVVPKTGYKLSVDGNIVCEELRVELSPWADYVFNKDYKLMQLDELEMFIAANNHLPGVPSADEVEKNGLRVGEMQATMMEKIEELTLYIIELKKQNELMSEKISSLESRSH